MRDRESALQRELRALHDRRASLEERIRFAQARIRFSATPEESAQAVEEERATAVELDRVMTRIRAAEAKLSIVRKGQRPPFG